MGYRIVNGKVFSIGNFEAVPIEKSKNKKLECSQVTFEKVLNEVANEKISYKISKHAAERLNEIDFTNEDMKIIDDGFKLAEAKGAKNSIMIYKNVVLIASIENKTLITAVEKNRAKENIFTNVDSVVIL